MILELSNKIDGEKNLSKNFKVKEFICKDGSDLILIDEHLIEILQKLRDYKNTPIKIISGYRTASYNLKCGGATNSQHIKGRAVDISFINGDNLDIVKYIRKCDLNMSIGLYDDYVHIDTRAYHGEPRAVWCNIKDNEKLKKVALAFLNF